MTLYADVHAALAQAGVRYVVVGGTAVVLQGYVRTTVDLDLVVDLAEEPAQRAMEALLSLGFLPRAPVDARAFADERTRRDWATTKHMQVFSMFDPQHIAREIDLFVAYPLDFDELFAAADRLEVDGVVVPVASRPHLMQMKREAGRPQDLADIAALEELGGEPDD